MKVSIVVPCRNAAPYLAQTLGSALDQTHPAHEIIIVENGSTDTSLARARQFESRLPGLVRVYQEQLVAASSARNLGAVHATGDALMFLDADDVLRRDAIQALVHALARAAGSVAACPWLRLERHEARWIERPSSCRPREPAEDPLSAWLTGWYYPPCAVLWSREAFERAGRWDEQITVNDDGDLMMRAFAFGVALQETSAGAAYYRRRADGQVSLSGTRLSRDAMASRLRVVEKIAYLLDTAGRLDPYRAALAGAAALVADDARSRYPDLCREARALAHRYGPRLTAQARALAARLLEPLRPPHRIDAIRRHPPAPSNRSGHGGARRARPGRSDVRGSTGLRLDLPRDASLARAAASGCVGRHPDVQSGAGAPAHAPERARAVLRRSRGPRRR